MQEIFDKLIDLFVQKNSKINLSAIRDPQDIKIKHIQDSLVWLKVLEKNNLINKKFDIVDIWTWSWFPLLPLAISKPQWDFIWIESVRKKVNAINDIIFSLWLKNVKVIWSRAEDFKQKQFDILTARAVAYIDKLFKYSYHLVKNRGYFLFYKLDSKEEFSDLNKLLKKYKLELVDIYKYKLLEDDISRVIYLIKKL